MFILVCCQNQVYANEVFTSPADGLLLLRRHARHLAEDVGEGVRRLVDREPVQCAT